VIVVRANDELAEEWLSEVRIESALNGAVMGPTEVDIWVAAAGATIVSIEFPKSTASPLRAIELHTLTQRFCDRLAAEWAEHTEAPQSFTVTPITSLAHLDIVKQNISDLNSLLEILVHKQLMPQFQPIVSLRDGRVFGYETLIRGPKGAAIRRPGQMFRVADKARLVAWFDLACLDVCLKTAAEHRLKHPQFVNMDAEGLYALAREERSIGLRVSDHGFSPADIVIEITERQTVGDFPRLIEDIQQIREQGFRIAIDDAGAGYSSLRAVSELKPEFVKIDRDIVKNVDVAGERRSLLKAIAQYAHQSGATVIAEGAETAEEVSTLIDLGIPYCQGYFLGKPADSLRGTPRPVREFIQECVEIREQRSAGQEIRMRQIARPGLLMDGGAPLSEAARRFAKSPGLTSIAVLEDDRVTGLLQRSQIEHEPRLTKPDPAAEANEIETLNRRVRTDVLRAEGDSLVTEVVLQVVTRQDLSLDGDVLVVDAAGNFEGVVPIRHLMDAASRQPSRRALYSDPLTGLPGRVVLDRELKSRIESRRPLTVIRIDLLGLAEINETMGLMRGDEVLRAAANAITTAVQCSGGRDDLCTHLGGDDFVLLTESPNPFQLCTAIRRAFDQSESVLARPPSNPTANGVLRRDRGAIYFAGVSNRERPFKSVTWIMATVNDGMRDVKSTPGERILIDRARG